MGLLANVVSMSQFKVVGVTPKDNFDTWCSEQLSHFGFRPIDDIAKENSIGWVTLDNIHINTFEDINSFSRTPYLCFSLRKDERKVPQAVLKHQLDLECQKWLAKHSDMKWVPKQRKAELKELIYSKLMSKTLAVPAIHDVVWNTQTNIISITTLNPKALEIFEKHFKQTFDGLSLVAIPPYNRAEMIVDSSLSARLSEHNKAGSDNMVDIIKDNKWIGQDFLLWLAYMTVESNSEYMISLEGPAELKEPYVAHINSRVQAVGEDEDGTKKIVLTGPQSRFKELKTALQGNLLLNEATIYFEKDENVWKLTLKGEMFTFASFKTPKVQLEKDELTDEIDEKQSVFYERMYLLELGQQMFDSLFLSFLKLRLTKKWQEIRKEIGSWIKG